MGGEGMSSAVLEDKAAGLYRKLVFQGDRLVGCVLVGEADDALWYLDLIRTGPTSPPRAATCCTAAPSPKPR